MVYAVPLGGEGVDVYPWLHELPASLRDALDDPKRFLVYAVLPYRPDLYTRVQAVHAAPLLDTQEWLASGDMLVRVPGKVQFKRLDEVRSSAVDASSKLRSRVCHALTRAVNKRQSIEHVIALIDNYAAAEFDRGVLEGIGG